MELYKCKHCPHEGPVEDFTKTHGKPNECKKCKCKRSKKHYAENRDVYVRRGPRRRFEAREIVNKIKRENPCLDCGDKFHYCQMDFDHRDQFTKRKQISYMLMLGIDTILKEIEKCDLVCANCHRDRTQRQIEALPSIEPTTPSGFDLRRVTEFINSLKHNQLCTDCGQPHPYWRLDFDHRDTSTKIMTISRLKLSKYSKIRILEEIAKCDLVCARCHRLRTFHQQRKLRAGDV